MAESNNESCRLILETARRAAASAGASPDVADDIAQQVALNLHQKWQTSHVRQARARGPGYWLSYVRRSSLNAFKDHIRSEQRRGARQRRALLGDDGPARPQRPGVLRRTDHEPTMLDQYLGRAYVVDLVRELLCGRQQEIALLALVDGLTVNEMAEKLDLKPRSIREHRKNAFDELRRQCLGRDREEDGGC